MSPRFCVECDPNRGAICDFCRFAAHNKPGVDQSKVSSTVCTKDNSKRRLSDGCDDFECCWGGKEYPWRE